MIIVGDDKDANDDENSSCCDCDDDGVKLMYDWVFYLRVQQNFHGSWVDVT